MSRLSREQKRELKRAERSRAGAGLAPIDVRVPASGDRATVGGMPVATLMGEPLQATVLDYLHRLALATGHPVLATVHDERIGYAVPLEIAVDGSSQFTGEPVRVAEPGAGTGPGSGSCVSGVRPPEPLPSGPVPPPVPAPAPAALPSAPDAASVPSAPAAAQPRREPDTLPLKAAQPRPEPEPGTNSLAAVQTFPGASDSSDSVDSSGSVGSSGSSDSSDSVGFSASGVAASTFVLRPGHAPAAAGEHVRDSGAADDTGTVLPPTGEFGPAPIPIPAPAPTPTSAPPRALAHPVPEIDDSAPKPAPVREFEVAETVMGTVEEDGAVPSPLARPVGRINEAVKTGRIQEAAELAELTTAQATGTLGPEHPEVLRLRELTAYIAYLAGDALRSFHLSLDLARLHHRLGDPRAAYGNVQSAAAAWRAVRDPLQGLHLGRDLLDVWTGLVAEPGPATDDMEQLDSARTRMGRLAERASDQ